MKLKCNLSYAKETGAKKHSKNNIILLYSILLTLNFTFIMMVYYIYSCYRVDIKREHVLYEPMFVNRDEPLTYTMVPNWNGVDHRVEVAINSDGFRDYDWPTQPEEDLRILVLGDSQTFGVAEEFTQIYSKQLEDRLRDQNSSIRVYNAGIPAWNFHDQLMCAKYYYSRIQPQFIVILYLSNDLDSPIVVGPWNQLMMDKKPFRSFFFGADAWLMESFAEAYKKDTSLDLNIDNAFQESWRIDPYMSLYTLGVSPSGKRALQAYRRDLIELTSLIETNQAHLFILVDSRSPGGMEESNVEKIYLELNVPYCFLSRWIGDYELYSKNWSHLPYNSHGNQKFHSLIASLIHLHLSEIEIGKSMGIRPPESVPQMLSPELYQTLVQNQQTADRETIDKIGGKVTLLEPDTLKQITCMGGQFTPVQAVYKLEDDSKAIRIIPARSMVDRLKQYDCAVWVTADEWTGFITVAKDEASIWGILPTELQQEKTIELGVIAGSVEPWLGSNALVEIFPIEEISLHSDLPIGLAWHKKTPWLTKQSVVGLSDDLWMSKSLTIHCIPHYQSYDRTSAALELTVESSAPQFFYPIGLQAITPEGKRIDELIIDRESTIVWKIELPIYQTNECNPFLVIQSDRTFKWSDFYPDNPDQRELSVRIKKIDLIVNNNEHFKIVRSAGFGPLEGPFPELHLPTQFRWLEGQRGSITIESIKRSKVELSLNLQTYCKNQKLSIIVNDLLIDTVDVSDDRKWNRIKTQAFELKEGENEIEFETSESVVDENINGRTLSIMVESIEINGFALIVE